MPPPDRQTKPNTSKPLTPALSSNFRNVRSPLTPRLGGGGSTASSPALSTRKEPFVRARSPGKADNPTALNGNITPRSGARKSRVGTESPSTPAPVRWANEGQPSKPASAPLKAAPLGQTPGLGISSPRLTASTSTLPRAGSAMSTPVMTAHRRVSAAKSMVEGNKTDISSKFFHADEAKSSIGSPGVDEGSRGHLGRDHYFVGSQLSNPAPAQALDATDGKEPDNKFFRANDISQLAPTKRPALPHIQPEKRNSLTISPTGQDHDADATRSSSQASPPQSPKKPQGPLLTHPTSPRKLLSGPSPSPPGHQRTQSGHRKSISASSVTAANDGKPGGPRMQPPQPLDLRLAPTSSPTAAGNNLLSPELLSPRSFSLTSTNTVPTSVSDTDCSEVPKEPLPSTDLPTDQATSPALPQNDPASNARRERKVLDLEISNSSLLAINKTLERELRKQSGELRRYRRLSRSGRLSLAPTTRTASGQSSYSLDTLPEQEGEDRVLSDMDEGSDLDDYFEDEEDSLISNDSSSLTSPSARSRQRARDEKRLILDLTKHQQVLLDSQKLSQSIRRCLTCTEELIRDGNRALEYRVAVGDVQLGGRVLQDDELDERGLQAGGEEQEARQGLLSPSLAKTQLDATQLWVEPSPVAATSTTTGMSSLDELTTLLESMIPEIQEPVGED